MASCSDDRTVKIWKEYPGESGQGGFNGRGLQNVAHVTQGGGATTFSITLLVLKATSLGSAFAPCLGIMDGRCMMWPGKTTSTFQYIWLHL